MAIYYNYKDHWDIQNELKADYEKVTTGYIN